MVYLQTDYRVSCVHTTKHAFVYQKDIVHWQMTQNPLIKTDNWCNPFFSRTLVYTAVSCNTFPCTVCSTAAQHGSRFVLNYYKLKYEYINCYPSQRHTMSSHNKRLNIWPVN